ncbi:MICAL-like protein 2 isoform X3 [Pelobates fuscus]|uniref:MICAL-like protein 2 isoform X3 n=1 Tax=Pelobates fuscus TaxID=191477 RepID=UPI002FE46FC1
MAAIKALQQWCKQQCDGYRDVSITNMTTSFRDGLAFCAILHKHRPDLINFNSLSKENVYENNHLAFHVAEEKLGIPALLDAEDMVSLRVPDRLSILTYVSQYYNYFHGRSPIGGLGAIKRPPPDTIEEHASKKVTNHTPALQPQPAPRTNPSILKENSVVENPPVRAGMKEINSNGMISSNCTICGNHVHLVQRHMADGKLYHRNCFKCKQCSRTLQPGNYKIGDDPGTFICINHHPSTTSPVTSNTSPSGPYKPVTGQNGPRFTSPAVQEQTNKTPTPKFSGITNSVQNETPNRTAMGFGGSNKSSPNIGMSTGQSDKVTHNYQMPTNKESPSVASTNTPEMTNRTAVGFYKTHKETPSAVKATGPENTQKAAPSNVTNRAPLNVPAQAYLQSLKEKNNTNSSLHQHTPAQKESKKEPETFGQQTKPSNSSSSRITVSSSFSGKWSPSPVVKNEPKDDFSSPKPSSSTAKIKEARDKFFQSTPAVIEPKNNQPPAGKESPKITVSNGPGRSPAITSITKKPEENTDKDKARNLILKAIPKSQSRADESKSGFFPQRNMDTPQSVSKPPGLKEEPKRPVPKERKSKMPATVSNPEPPKSTPTVTVTKGAATPTPEKNSIPNTSGLSSTVKVQKGDDPPPKAQMPSSKVSKAEAPEDWRSMLKSVNTRPSIEGAQLEKEKSHLRVEDKTSQKKPVSINSTVTVTINTNSPGKENKPSQLIATPTSTSQVAKGVEKAPTVIVTITPNLPASGKDHKSNQRPASPAESHQEDKKEEKASTTTPSRKKLLPAKVDLISDWPQPKLKWQDEGPSSDTEPPKWRPHLSNSTDTSSTNNTKLPPLVTNGDSNIKTSNYKPPNFMDNKKGTSQNKLNSEYIPEEYIQQELQIIEQELDYLELRGVDLEKQLRSSDGDDSEDALMVDWFKLIHEKQLLLRRESELNYISRTQVLESQQLDVETELRNLMNKPESLKTAKETEREKELLEKYLLIVNDRSEIIECLDEDRIREKEEDEVMKAMIEKHSADPQQKESPEPNLKRRSRFSFSGLFKGKDKNKT